MLKLNQITVLRYHDVITIKFFEHNLKRFSCYIENCTVNRATLVEKNDVSGQRQNKRSDESL